MIAKAKPQHDSQKQTLQAKSAVHVKHPVTDFTIHDTEFYIHVMFTNIRN